MSQSESGRSLGENRSPGTPGSSGQISFDGVRRWAGLPPGMVPVDQARNAGRRLAHHPLLTARPDGQDVIPQMLRDSHWLLESVGVRLELLRTKPGCAVLRGTPLDPTSGTVACEIVHGLLEAVPEAAHDPKGTVIETTCTRRGADACLYTLLWNGATAPELDSTSIGRAPAPVARAVVPAGEVEPSSARAGTIVLPELAQALAEGGGDGTRLSKWVLSGGRRRTDGGGSASTPGGARRYDGEPQPVGGSGTGTAIAGEGSALAGEGSALAVEVADPPDLADALEVPGSDRPLLGRIALPRRAPWLRRRAWLLVLALVAGATGGSWAANHSAVSYSAQATLVVQSGASVQGPGSANEAGALAVTYAALLPTDQAILRAASGFLHLSPAGVESHLSVSVETGTSLLLLDYHAPTSSQALGGADVVARIVAGTPPTSAIAAGSVVIVHLPTTASHSGTLHKYGLPVGAILGLVLGFVLVLAAERADPRADDSEALARAASCPAASLPDDVSLPELARAVARATEPCDTLTLVPLAIPDTGAAMALHHRLAAHWPPTHDGVNVEVSPSFESGAIELSRGSGPTLLVLRAGARLREVARAVDRLRLIERRPVWAVLVNGRRRPDVAGDDE